MLGISIQFISLVRIVLVTGVLKTTLNSLKLFQQAVNFFFLFVILEQHADLREDIDWQDHHS
jgi:hypothetical protein